MDIFKTPWTSMHLNRSRITNKGGRHLQAPWRDITHSSLFEEYVSLLSHQSHSNLYVVGNPFNEVGAVLILDAQHLIIYLLHGHPPSRKGNQAPAPFNMFSKFKVLRKNLKMAATVR